MERRTPQRPRIADVAREAGVSKTAVSFAFNRPDRLAPDTAQRIRDVAAAMGYRPDPVARTLSQRRTHTIGVLTPQALSVVFSNPFFGAFSEGVAIAAEESGYALYFISPMHGSLAGAMRSFDPVAITSESPASCALRRSREIATRCSTASGGSP